MKVICIGMLKSRRKKKKMEILLNQLKRTEREQTNDDRLTEANLKVDNSIVNSLLISSGFSIDLNFDNIFKI